MRAAFSTFSLAATAALVAVLASSAEAQVIRRPERSRGGLFGGDSPVDPNRTRSQLSMDFDLLGGWDDDFYRYNAVVEERDLARRSDGYLGVGTAAMRFWRGRASRAFEANARTHVTSYSHEPPLTGGDGSLAGHVNLGRRTDLSGEGRISYTPALTLNAFSPVEGLSTSGIVANADPTRSAAEISSRGLSGSAGVNHRWTPRHTTGVTVEGHARDFSGADDIVAGYNNGWGRSAAVSHAWALNRTSALTLGYRYSGERFEDRGNDIRPADVHGAEVGYTSRRTLSPTRTLAWGVSGGASHVQAISTVRQTPYDHVTASGGATARIDIARSWGLAGDYRRSISTLDGIVMDLFVTDATSLTVGGNLGSRLSLAVSGAYSNGKTRSDSNATFRNYIGTTQLQYAFSSWGAAVSSYSYYNHRLRDVVDAPEEFPLRLIRHSVRVGVTIQLPLFGNFTSGPAGTSN